MPADTEAYGDWSDDVNNSGTSGPLPIEVLRMGWSWGAFIFSWMWALANRVYYAAILAILASSAISMTPHGHRGAGFATGVTIISVWLGVAGHRLAWRHRRFQDVRQYQDTMRTWNRWGFGLFLVGVVGFVVYLACGVWALTH
jgi:hypothetical protein